MQVAGVADVGVLVVEVADRRAGLGEVGEEVQRHRFATGLAEPDQRSVRRQQAEGARERIAAHRLQHDVERSARLVKIANGGDRAERKQPLGAPRGSSHDGHCRAGRGSELGDVVPDAARRAGDQHP